MPVVTTNSIQLQKREAVCSAFAGGCGCASRECYVVSRDGCVAGGAHRGSDLAAMISAMQRHVREDVFQRRGVLVTRAVPICNRTLRRLRGETGYELLIRGSILGSKPLGFIERKGRPHHELRRGAADA